jgi:hypothetical protein
MNIKQKTFQKRITHKHTNKMGAANSTSNQTVEGICRYHQGDYTSLVLEIKKQLGEIENTSFENQYFTRKDKEEILSKRKEFALSHLHIGIKNKGYMTVKSFMDKLENGTLDSGEVYYIYKSHPNYPSTWVSNLVKANSLSAQSA